MVGDSLFGQGFEAEVVVQGQEDGDEDGHEAGREVRGVEVRVLDPVGAGPVVDGGHLDEHDERVDHLKCARVECLTRMMFRMSRMKNTIAVLSDLQNALNDPGPAATQVWCKLATSNRMNVNRTYAR